VGRDDVPAQSVDPEVREDALDDRGRGLGWSPAGELPLRSERDPGDARAAVAGGFAHEQQGCTDAGLEVSDQALPAEIRSVPFPVEVERRPDSRRSQLSHEPFRLHAVTMLMPVTGRIAALAVACAGVCAPAAHAAPPQGFQSDAAFAASYVARGVVSVPATTQRVSCYAPQVFYQGSLAPSQGFPDGGSTLCGGAATTGENVGPYPTQDASNPPLRAKDFSESDIRVDPTNPRHLIGVSKWFVNAEGYNHLNGFFESFDGGLTWPQQGHIPGYEGWTDNTDPVGAFDPWGNFYAVSLPYMFSYLSTGEHFLSTSVNPSLARMGMGIAVRPRGAATATAWSFTHRGRLDLIARTPFNGASSFDKQWLTIDTNRRSRYRGRVYVSWAIGTGGGLRIFVSYADARPNGTHTDWSRPRLVMRQTRGIGDNGSLLRVTPDGRVWLTTASFRRGGFGSTLTMSFTSSRNGGRTWAPRRVIVRHDIVGYRNTTFRAAFGETFAVGSRRIRRFYPLYVAYEDATGNGATLFIRASFDGGRRWSRPLQVNDNADTGEAMQPSLTVAPNGTVAVAFYDRRLPCPERNSPEATIAGLLFDPRAPFGRRNYCVNTAIQFYRANLRPLGHNVRLSPHTWDPQLSAPRFDCICSAASFIGDYFGADSRGGFTYTASVETFNAGGENPGYHQQQLVSKIRTP
jgi:hypothetical protein